KVLPQIESDWIVLKPNNGLKGIGIYIGPKEKAVDFEFSKTKKEYIAQEFVDTSKGIEGLTKSNHDLRIVIVNAKIVWSHVRTPPKGSLEANVARGGSINEIDLNMIPERVKEVVAKITKLFSEKYDNPIYSLDFGFQDGHPFLFEINDTIGFPRWEMKNRDNFLKELVENFKQKLNN
ncbi:MAG TPA: hypothetical protein VLE44_03190, partial [Candidatus Saccharimonadales bacterium]|nr:hypothetical protein [Candidatus Saccharimonadales bacterium]